ncbi:phospholipase A1 member A isoform X2 [Hyalella azteca]|uniref:Phospholipase A1 member A isoform X1 n=1 Tax=Hyalella azteca TaxID=294128 RepID=A0A8B7P7A8_HYAAZ|nr:phospholipase A1 member A isoform X1 [Hyalella azteca]XP_047735878.1 phospholipase A1 member A isoform X2 [Hyalella azteca]
MKCIRPTVLAMMALIAAAAALQVEGRKMSPLSFVLGMQRHDTRQDLTKQRAQYIAKDFVNNEPELTDPRIVNRGYDGIQNGSVEKGDSSKMVTDRNNENVKVIGSQKTHWDVSRTYQQLGELFSQSNGDGLGAFYEQTADDIHFGLYTTKNPVEDERLVAADSDSLTQSHFDANKQSVVVVHGFTGSLSGCPWMVDIKDSFIRKDMNVVLVDWGALSGSDLMSYFHVVEYNVPFVGLQLAALLQALKENVGLSEDKLHLIGFSLGAHVCGFAGKNFRNISRITGLDPAGPAYQSADEDRRLCASDANFVDIVHTDMEVLGFSGQLGHVDFFMNGGLDQGCNMSCSHATAYEYFNSSIWNIPVLGYQCDDENAFERGECFNHPSNYFGANANPDKPGNYYMMTIHDDIVGTGKLARHSLAEVQLPAGQHNVSRIRVSFTASVPTVTGGTFHEKKSIIVDNKETLSQVLVTPLNLSVRDVTVKLGFDPAFGTEIKKSFVLPSISFQDIVTGEKFFACNVTLKPIHGTVVTLQEEPCAARF